VFHGAADLPQQEFLLFVERRLFGEMDEEVIIAHRVAAAEHLLERFSSLGLVREADRLSGRIENSAVEHQTIDDLLLHEVLEREIDAEHVPAEASAVAFISNAVVSDVKFISRGEESDRSRSPVRRRLVEELVPDRAAGDRGEVLDLRIDLSVKANVFDHSRIGVAPGVACRPEIA
jgi:hypothetical protein